MRASTGCTVVNHLRCIRTGENHSQIMCGGCHVMLMYPQVLLASGCLVPRGCSIMLASTTRRAPPTSAAHDASTSQQSRLYPRHQACWCLFVPRTTYIYVITAGPDYAKVACSNIHCRVVLMYPRGAPQVQCSLCGTITNAQQVRMVLVVKVVQGYVPTGQHGGPRGVWQLSRDVDVPVWCIVRQVLAVPSRDAAGPSSATTEQRGGALLSRNVCAIDTTYTAAGSAISPGADTDADGGGGKPADA